MDVHAVANRCLVQRILPSRVYVDRPLSRRLDRCDRVIQDEFGDSIGGAMRHNENYVRYA